MAAQQLSLQPHCFVRMLALLGLRSEKLGTHPELQCLHPVNGKHALCCTVFAAQLTMQTATDGGRPTSRPTTSTSSGEGRKAASAAAAAGDGCETLEHLSATALLQLLKLADATQQLAPLFLKLPSDNSSSTSAAQAQAQDGSSSGNGGDSAAAVAAAVMPRLPQLLACTDSLLQQGCCKEAQVWRMQFPASLHARQVLHPAVLYTVSFAGCTDQQTNRHCGLLWPAVGLKNKDWSCGA